MATNIRKQTRENEQLLEETLAEKIVIFDRMYPLTHLGRFAPKYRQKSFWNVLPYGIRFTFGDDGERKQIALARVCDYLHGRRIKCVWWDWESRGKSVYNTPERGVIFFVTQEADLTPILMILSGVSTKSERLRKNDEKTN